MGKKAIFSKKRPLWMGESVKNTFNREYLPRLWMDCNQNLHVSSSTYGNFICVCFEPGGQGFEPLWAFAVWKPAFRTLRNLCAFAEAVFGVWSLPNFVWSFSLMTWPLGSNCVGFESKVKVTVTFNLKTLPVNSRCVSWRNSKKIGTSHQTVGVNMSCKGIYRTLR